MVRVFLKMKKLHCWEKPIKVQVFGTGSALENLNLRLKGLFGKSAALQFEST